MNRMNEFKNWIESTSGIYKYGILAEVAYEIHIIRYKFSDDLLNARASLYRVGIFIDSNGKLCFQRDMICREMTVRECVEEAVKHYQNNSLD